jgi:hypothetical protein
MATPHADEPLSLDQAGHAPLALLPAPSTPPRGVPGLRVARTARRRAGAPNDEVAAARARKARERASVELFVEKRLIALEHEEHFVIPRLYVVITGSLAPASALKLIEAWSERSYGERGTPWVFMPLETWTAYTALSEDDWVSARAVLRDMQLITERRRFDLERNEIVTEVSFAPERFSAEVARVREQLRDDAWAAVRADQPL